MLYIVVGQRENAAAAGPCLVLAEVEAHPLGFREYSICRYLLSSESLATQGPQQGPLTVSGKGRLLGLGLEWSAMA